ncbi:MAG: RNA polymerase sigma factor [Thermoanaerobaculia bacterium]
MTAPRGDDAEAGAGGERVRKRRRIDRRRVAHLYEELYGPLVRQAGWNRRVSLEDAEDIAQDSFVLALGKMGSKGNAAAWLARVVDHLAANVVRTRGRRAEILQRWAQVSERIEEETEEDESGTG